MPVLSGVHPLDDRADRSAHFRAARCHPRTFLQMAAPFGPWRSRHAPGFPVGTAAYRTSPVRGETAARVRIKRLAATPERVGAAVVGSFTRSWYRCVPA